MALKSSEECQNVHSVVVLPDGGTSNLHDIHHAEVPNMMKKDMSVNFESNLQNIANFKTDKVSNHAPCILDVDIEKGKAENHNSKEDSVDNLKFDDPLARALQRGIWLQIGGNFMQFLMNHVPELPKFISRDKVIPERVYDTPINRSRKYKRSQSFNSRRVVLMFSVLSSLGTIILIYLTLRVRQIADGTSNV